jgi:hypothetical protein
MRTPFPTKSLQFAVVLSNRDSREPLERRPSDG